MHMHRTYAPCICTSTPHGEKLHVRDRSTRMHAYAQVTFAGSCFGRPAGEVCFENTTVKCTVPPAAEATLAEVRAHVHVHAYIRPGMHAHAHARAHGLPCTMASQVAVSTNGNDPISGPHFVPVLGQPFTYYTVPIVSQLIPPGGPVRGGTAVTVRGAGFGGLGASLSTLQCSFEGSGGSALSILPSGEEIVCQTTSAGAADRAVRVSINGQDFDDLVTFRFYERPQLAYIQPTGGPELPGYTVTLHGTRFTGMEGVPMPYAPLCQVGERYGTVVQMGSEAVSQADDSTEGNGGNDAAAEEVEPRTYLECVVPRPASVAAGGEVVRLALNGYDFDDGMPDDPAAYELATGIPAAPRVYKYFAQRLTALTPVGGPTGGGTSITVAHATPNLPPVRMRRRRRARARAPVHVRARCHSPQPLHTSGPSQVVGEGFFGFDGLASTAHCQFDYLGVLSIGPVTRIRSDRQLMCTVPRARFSGETSVKVAINGVHFVGMNSSLGAEAAPSTTAAAASATSAGRRLSEAQGGDVGGFDSSATVLAAASAQPQAAGYDGGTRGLSFLYYQEPQIYSITPQSGPVTGSTAVGVSQAVTAQAIPSVFVVTLHGRGFDRLASRSATSKCRFGGRVADIITLGSSYALCLLPPGRTGEALVEFSVNGQNFVSQRDLVYFDATNLTNATHPETEITTADPAFIDAQVPLPSYLPNRSLVALPTADHPELDAFILFAHHRGGTYRGTVRAVVSANVTTSIRAIHNGSHLYFKYYDTSIESILPRGGPVSVAATLDTSALSSAATLEHDSNVSATAVAIYGYGFDSLPSAISTARCMFGTVETPVLAVEQSGVKPPEQSPPPPPTTAEASDSGDDAGDGEVVDDNVDIVVTGTRLEWGGSGRRTLVRCAAPPFDLGNASAAYVEVALALNGLHFVSARPPAMYRYIATSALSIHPTGGPVGGGTLVTVRGRGLASMNDMGAGIRCKFGDQKVRVMLQRTADGSKGHGDTDGLPDETHADYELRCIAPPRHPATRGISAFSLTLNVYEYLAGGEFTYYDDPHVYGILPTGGPMSGGTLVTVLGHGFDGLGGNVRIRDCACAWARACIVLGQCFNGLAKPPPQPARSVPRPSTCDGECECARSVSRLACRECECARSVSRLAYRECECARSASRLACRLSARPHPPKAAARAPTAMPGGRRALRLWRLKRAWARAFYQ